MTLLKHLNNALRIYESGSLCRSLDRRKAAFIVSIMCVDWAAHLVLAHSPPVAELVAISEPIAFSRPSLSPSRSIFSLTPGALTSALLDLSRSTTQLRTSEYAPFT